MIDIKFLRENPDVVKENIRKKFQDEKLVLVDEVIGLDVKNRTAKLNGKCKPDGYTDYNNFDTNAELFYYDAANKKSDVEVTYGEFIKSRSHHDDPWCTWRGKGISYHRWSTEI